MVAFYLLFLYSVFSISTMMVVYRRDSVVMAAGHLEENWLEIHGKRVPTDHVCVLLTTAKSNVTAPFIGNPGETLFWRKESFLLFLNNSYTKQVLWIDHSSWHHIMLHLKGTGRAKQFLYQASLLNGSLQLAPYHAKL